MTVFMSVACGAGTSAEPNFVGVAQSITAPATAQQATPAPIN